METSMTDNKKSLPDDGEADTFIGVPDDSFPNRYDDILVDWVSAIDSSTINRPITGGKIVITHTSISAVIGFLLVEIELVRPTIFRSQDGECPTLQPECKGGGEQEWTPRNQTSFEERPDPKPSNRS